MEYVKGNINNSTKDKAMTAKLETIVVLDFGSQYSQLIARRIRECNVYSKILPFNVPAEKLRQEAPSGIILSGGRLYSRRQAAPGHEPRTSDKGLNNGDRQ